MRFVAAHTAAVGVVYPFVFDFFMEIACVACRASGDAMSVPSSSGRRGRVGGMPMLRAPVDTGGMARHK